MNGEHTEEMPLALRTTQAPFAQKKNEMIIKNELTEQENANRKGAGAKAFETKKRNNVQRSTFDGTHTSNWGVLIKIQISDYISIYGAFLFAAFHPSLSLFYSTECVQLYVVRIRLFARQ